MENAVKKTSKKVSLKYKPNQKYYGGDKQDRINICLDCTKPASKCKGECFGRSC